MYLDGEFYSLFLRKTSMHFTNTLSRLDSQILYERVLAPILGIKDLRKDKRISYIPGKKDILEMKKLVDSGEFAVGFGMMPASISEIKQIADEGSKLAAGPGQGAVGEGKSGRTLLPWPGILFSYLL